MQPPQLVHTARPQEQFEIQEPPRVANVREPVDLEAQRRRHRPAPATETQRLRLRNVCLSAGLGYTTLLSMSLAILLLVPHDAYCELPGQDTSEDGKLSAPAFVMVMMGLMCFFSIFYWPVARNQALGGQMGVFSGPKWWFGPACALVSYSAIFMVGMITQERDC